MPPGAPGTTAVGASPPARYDPHVDPADFGGPVDNPWFPLVPGTRWAYVGTTDAGTEHDVVVVTHRTRRVMGVRCVVVRDTVTVDGRVSEDTLDWYAQDRHGNVWYFGEDTREYERGKVVSRAGSWEAGVHGAQPGVIMKASPRVGDRYRQEHLRGRAEDRARVLALHESVTVPAGAYADALETEDFTPLEPGIVERKYYARGIGLVLETTVRGGSERVELVRHTPPAAPAP